MMKLKPAVKLQTVKSKESNCPDLLIIYEVLYSPFGNNNKGNYREHPLVLIPAPVKLLAELKIYKTALFKV